MSDKTKSTKANKQTSNQKHARNQTQRKVFFFFKERGRNIEERQTEKRFGGSNNIKEEDTFNLFSPQGDIEGQSTDDMVKAQEGKIAVFT